MKAKTSLKVKAIEKVQVATEVAMEAVISYLRSTKNPTSEKAHEIIDSVLKKYNCVSPEGHIVACGEQSVEPHNIGTGKIKRRASIVIDIFPQSKNTGYFSDMSRTVCIGKPPAKLQKMYNTVLEAQELALSMIKPKVKCSEIQVAVESFFVDKGYITSGKGKEFKFAKGFVHGVGHGVGLKIHEHPRIGRNSKDVLEEGDVVTIEPGLYYPNLGGVRLEDLVLVTKKGFKNLTHFPKRFEI